jgi:hypothetical protein
MTVDVPWSPGPFLASSPLALARCILSMHTILVLSEQNRIEQTYHRLHCPHCPRPPFISVTVASISKQICRVHVSLCVWQPLNDIVVSAAGKESEQTWHTVVLFFLTALVVAAEFLVHTTQSLSLRR